MYKADQGKWNRFPPQVQLQHIAVELTRATKAGLRNDKEEKEWAFQAYERALSLIDSSLSDPKWEEKKFLYQLRDAVAALYAEKTDPALARFISSQLLERSEKLS